MYSFYLTSIVAVLECGSGTDESLEEFGQQSTRHVREDQAAYIRSSFIFGSEYSNLYITYPGHLSVEYRESRKFGLLGIGSASLSSQQ